MISKAEIIVLLVLSRLGAGITMVQYGFHYDMERFLAVLVSFVIIFLLYIPLIIYTRKHSTVCFTEAIAKKHRVIATIIEIISKLLLFLAAVIALGNIVIYLKNTIAREFSLLLIIILLLLAVLFAVHKGIETIAHVGLFVGTGFLIVLAGICIAEIPDVNINFLYMGLFEHANTFWHSVLVELAMNAEFLIMPFLVPLIQENRKNPPPASSADTVPFKSKKMLPVIAIYLGASTIISLLLLFYYNTVFGAFVDTVQYPLVLLGTLSNIGIVSQLDGFLGVVMVGTATLKISLFMGLIMRSRKTVGEKQEARR